MEPLQLFYSFESVLVVFCVGILISRFCPRETNSSLGESIHSRNFDQWTAVKLWL